MQALLNLIDHGMSLQEAVEAPRVWTQGQALEVEAGVARRGARRRWPRWATTVQRAAARRRRHERASASTTTARWTGAACWRADGTAIGLGGGLAREGVRFWPDLRRG